MQPDRSATKIPHTNCDATVHYHIVRKEGTVSWVVKDRSSKKIVFFCGTTAVDDDDGYDIASALLEQN